MVDDDLMELVKSIKNHCDIFLQIAQQPQLMHTIYTILEDLCQDAQRIITDYCEEK